jgi:transcription antitermination factor NusG
MSSSTLDGLIQLCPGNFEEVPWYALRVRGRYEKAVARNLLHGGHSAFLPLHVCAHRWSDRIQKVELPLFPNYVFCHCDPVDKISILNIPGVISFVGIGKKPQPVNGSEMSSLQAVVRSGLFLKPWPFLTVGQRVVIQEGPLRNVEGLLSQVTDQNQLIVNITLLQRSVAVTIDRSWIRPLDNHGSTDDPLKKGPVSVGLEVRPSQYGRSG